MDDSDNTGDRETGEAVIGKVLAIPIPKRRTEEMRKVIAQQSEIRERMVKLWAKDPWLLMAVLVAVFVLRNNTWGMGLELVTAAFLMLNSHRGLVRILRHRNIEVSEAQTEIMDMLDELDRNGMIRWEET